MGDGNLVTVQNEQDFMYTFMNNITVQPHERRDENNDVGYLVRIHLRRLCLASSGVGKRRLVYLLLL